MGTSAEILISRIRKRQRFDADYYRPENFYIEDTIRRQSAWTTLGSVARPLFSKGIFDIRADEYVQHGVPFVRITNLRNGLIELDGITYLTAERSKKDQRTELSQYDVVLSKTAYPAASLVQLPVCNVSQDIIAVKTNRDRKFNCFLVAFLNGRFGLPQMKRLFQGNIQSHLGLVEARDILVPLPSEQFMTEIERLFLSALTHREMANILFVSGQRLLQDELGFEGVDFSPRKAYETGLAKICRSRRWDSEFYKPKYMQAMDAVLKAKKIKLERFIPTGRLVSYITNGHTPLHHDLTIGDILFLTAEHVTDFQLDFATDKRILRVHHETELARTALREEDILVTIKGKVGNCAVVRNCPKAANINQDVALIRLRNGTHPYFFAAWFNSPMGKQLVEQRSTGGINPFLGLGNLRGMPFPVVDPEEQQRIGDLVQDTIERAHSAEREAASLFENAKRRIEELIEQGTATNGGA